MLWRSGGVQGGGKNDAVEVNAREEQQDTSSILDSKCTAREEKTKQNTELLEWKLCSMSGMPLATLYYYRKGWTSEKDKGGPSVMRSFQHLNPELAEEKSTGFLML